MDLVEVREQVQGRFGYGYGFEHHHSDVSAHDAPRTKQRYLWAHTAHEVVVFSTGQRHGGDEFGIHDTNKCHDDTATHKREQRSYSAGLFNPPASENNPAEADHGAEAYKQRIEAAHCFVEN